MTNTATKRLEVYPLWLWLPLAGYYLIGFTGLIYEPLQNISLEILNSGASRNPSETALIEHLEAFFWLVATIFYSIVAYKQRVACRGFLWPAIFACLCFVALGEEISWGQHLLQFEPPQTFEQVNTQRELNIHNLHLAKVLGLSPANPLYRYMGSLTALLNPLFYLVCIFLWLIAPIVISVFAWDKKYRFLKSFPHQTAPFYTSFLIAICMYGVVDNFIFDAGELFELTMATVGALTGAIQLQKMTH
jgi:hypothetical protein